MSKRKNFMSEAHRIHAVAVITIRQRALGFGIVLVPRFKGHQIGAARFKIKIFNSIALKIRALAFMIGVERHLTGPVLIKGSQKPLAIGSEALLIERGDDGELAGQRNFPISLKK